MFKLGVRVGSVKKPRGHESQDYKRLKMKDKLPKMGEEEAIQLLASNGNLVKRPFVLTKPAGLWASTRRNGDIC